MDPQDLGDRQDMDMKTPILLSSPSIRQLVLSSLNTGKYFQTAINGAYRDLISAGDTDGVQRPITED